MVLSALQFMPDSQLIWQCWNIHLKMQVLDQPQVSTSTVFRTLKLLVCNGTQTTCKENDPATIIYMYFCRNIRICYIFKDTWEISAFSKSGIWKVWPWWYKLIKIDVYHSLLTTVDKENISISVSVYFIKSNQQRRFHFLCLLEGNTLMSAGPHRNREVHRCTLSSTKVNCHNQLSICSSLGCVALVRAVAAALEGPTELAVLVQVCLCSLTTPPGSREIFSKQMSEERQACHWVCGTPATSHLLPSQCKSVEQHKKGCGTKHSQSTPVCSWHIPLQMLASGKRLWGLEGNMQSLVMFT